MRIRKSFTMAEILISLTIIGVIAAITLPALRANINEKTWATQKRALFSRMSQAVALLDAQNSYSNAQAYITEGLNEVLKINNICAQDSLKDCGITTSNVTTTKGGTISFPATWLDLGIKTYATNSMPAGGDWGDDTDGHADYVGAFETQNGESIAVYYNPNCVPNNDDAPSVDDTDMLKYVCANLIYDLNQDKGPNTIGKDIGFMTIFYASDPVVVNVVPTAKTVTAAACVDDYRAPNLEEAVAMHLNWKLLTNTAINYMNTSARAVANNDIYYYKVKSVNTGTTQSLYQDGSQTATFDVTINRYGQKNGNAPTEFYCIKR